MIGKVFKFKSPKTESDWGDHLGAYGEIWIKVVSHEKDPFRDYKVKVYARNGSGGHEFRHLMGATLAAHCEPVLEDLKPFEEWL